MSVNIKAALRTDRVKSTGECSIVIRVLLGARVLHTEKTGKSVKPELWDPKKRKVKPEHPNARLYNIGIAKRIADMEAPLLQLEIEGHTLTPNLIKRTILGKDPGMDFFKFCLEYIPTVYCEARQRDTRRTYFAELSKLRRFRSEVNFHDLNIRFLNEYRAHMLTELGNHPNTVWKTFKFIKTMVNAACKVGQFKGKSAFQEYSIGKYRQGSRDFLEREDLEQIQRVLDSPIPDAVRRVGYYYLLMCYSGLRFTDAMTFNPSVHAADGERIRMITHKKQMEVNLYMHQRLRKVVDFIKEHPLKITNQEFNRVLKVLATLADLRINLTAHVGRHTFGAMLAELDIPKEQAQKLLGHGDIRSTTVYYHLKEKSLDNAMKRFDML